MALTANNILIYGNVYETTINNYYGQSNESTKQAEAQDKADATQSDTQPDAQRSEAAPAPPQQTVTIIDYGFNRALIIAIITADDKEAIADILIEMMGVYKGKNDPKRGLLPFYCAVYEVNWISTRPEYDYFNLAFPGICNSNASYSNYVPMARELSNYLKETCRGIDLENINETLQNKLNKKIKER